MRPVRVLVIGAGPATVAMHLPVLARLRDAGEIVLVLVCDIDRGRAAAARQQFGFLEDAGDGIAALQRLDIDAVYIFASAQLHYEYGRVALYNGKHLFVEKPIAPSYAQANEMAQAALAQGLIAAGGHNRRFYRTITEVQARAGKTGWRSVEVVFHKAEYGKPAPFGARSWLTANGIHALDVIVFTMGGLPEQLSAFASHTGGGAPAVFSAVMCWPNGAHGVFLCNNNAGARREEYVFHGVAETCRVTEIGLTVERDNVATNTPIVSIGDGIAAEHEAFLQAIYSGKQPLHSIDAIAPSLFLAELIELGFTGRVDVPSAEPVNVAAQCEIAGSILVDQSSELQTALARLLPRYRLVSIKDVQDSPEQRLDIVAAILARGSTGLDPDILAKLPKLAVVGVIGLSLARYQPEALLSRSITLVNASEAYAESVAEFALGLAILSRRRAFASHALMRAGGWGTDPGLQGILGWLHRAFRRARSAVAALRLESFFRRVWRTASRSQLPALRANGAAPRDLRGAVVGLIGWGANARAFAVHLVRAQARVLVYSEHAMSHAIIEAGGTPSSLDEVLAADIVSLHRGLTPRTRHFLGAAELAKLRPGSTFINVARGALTEPAAPLLARLKQGDVFACSGHL